MQTLTQALGDEIIKPSWQEISDRISPKKKIQAD